MAQEKKLGPSELKISVDTTELDEAIAKAERLVELLQRADTLLETQRARSWPPPCLESR
jgi:hypothetical protein